MSTTQELLDVRERVDILEGRVYSIEITQKGILQSLQGIERRLIGLEDRMGRLEGHMGKLEARMDSIEDILV